MKLPKTIYARVEENASNEPYLLSWPTLADAVDEDGPTVIGVYQLVEVQTVSKTIEISRRKPVKPQ